MRIDSIALLPREKLIQQGASQLSDSELLSVIFGTGSCQESVFDLSVRLTRYGSTLPFACLPAEHFAKELEIPLVKVCQLQASIELGRRLFAQRDREKETLRTPEQVFQHVQDITLLKKEVFRGLYLDCHHRLIHDEWISVGSLSMSLVHPREVFQPAIQHSAYSIIVVHNHPSGDPNPSVEDRALTGRLLHSAKLLGIELIDHVIVTREGFVSFQKEGWLV